MSHPLYVYYHTHWDREWYLPFREYQHRLLKVVDGVLESLENNSLPCFTLDGQTVLLEDYLEFRPDRRARLEKLIRDERVNIGPWYVMPDEFLVSGESLIRNLQRGIAISKAFGETSFTGYLPDTFGHSADIPMVLKQFEIPSAIVWRGVSERSPFFLWQSPSGDSVLTYHLTEGYFQNTFHMGKDLDEKKTAFNNWLSKVSTLERNGEPMLFPIGADHLGVVPDAPELLTEMAPAAQTVTPDRFMQQAARMEESVLDTLFGELRQPEGAYLLPGVFSSRMYLKQWNRRLEWRLAQHLEQLLFWLSCLGKPMAVEAELDFLWKTLLLNHPHDSICGCSVDSVHRENENRFEQIDQLSQAMLRDAHHALAQTLQPEGHLLLMNLGDVPYTGVMEIEQTYPLSRPVPEPVPQAQVLYEEEMLDDTFLLDVNILPLSENKALKRRSLIWVENVPAHGYQVTQTPAHPADQVTTSGRTLENALLSVRVEADGSLTIQEKTTGRVISKTHQVWRNLEQGDSYNAAPIPGAEPEQAVLESSRQVIFGQLRGAIELMWRFPNIDLKVETTLSLDAGSNQLVFHTRFTNNTPDHKIQVIFPAAEPITQVVAEGHFAPITRAYDPAYRIQEHMPAPRLKELPVQAGPIQRFIGFDGQTLTTEGLTEYEVEGNLLKLTLHRGFGMLSSDRTEVRGSHAGPPLPTPEGQCLNRTFHCHYAWRAGFDVAAAYHQADQFYGAVYGFDYPSRSGAAVSAKMGSFVTLDNPAVHHTAIQPVSGGTSWLIRLYNPTETPQQTQVTLDPQAQLQQVVNLAGSPLSMPSTGKLTLQPYQLVSLQVRVQ